MGLRCPTLLSYNARYFIRTLFVNRSRPLPFCMKSPVALFVVSLLTLVYVVFRVLNVRPRAIPASDVALIHYAMQRCWGCEGNGPTYGIDTAFAFPSGPTSAQVHAWRKRIVHQALTGNSRAGFAATAAVAPLVTPNTSPAVRTLQRQLAAANGNTGPVF